MGEHGVVYGAKALAVPLLSFQTRMELSHKPILSHPEIPMDLLTPTFEKALGFFPALPFKPFWNLQKSTLPLGAGLGSSASFCVALLRALGQLTETLLPKEKLAYLANELEKDFHGRPSGLDTAVIAFEAPLVFCKETNPEPLMVRPIRDGKPWPFLLMDTKQRSSTKDMVERAAPFFAKNRDKKIETFNTLTRLTQTYLETGDLPGMANAMEEGWRLLKEVGVVTQSMEGVASLARKAGVLGVKPTGAGGGGCLLALLPPDRKTQVLSQLTETLGAGAFWEAPLPQTGYPL
jgi:mevalonate kinase